MSSVDLVVVFSPVGGGHKAAALAVAEAARERGLSVELVDMFDHAPRWVGDAYLAAHLAGQSAAPELYGKMYFAANHAHGPLDPVRRRLDALVFGELEDRIAALSPRAVVATHHLPLVVLGRARRKQRLQAPVVGVVTDYTAHACWFEVGADLYAVPFGKAKQDLVAHGVPPERIVETGIPVRAAFERVSPLSLRRDPAAPVRVLVTSGGFGVGPMTRVVQSFVGVRDVEVTVVCGAAERLAATLRTETTAKVLGFERDMAARMAEADVVVGKAGGLTVTETLTAGRALVIAAAVPGNEAVNERFVVDGAAGISAKPEAVGWAVQAMRSQLGVMGERARRLVPTSAASRVVDLAWGRSVRRGRAA